MRLIPPDGAPTKEVETATRLLYWDNGDGLLGVYILKLPGVTNQRKDHFIPHEYSHALSEDLGPNWHVSNRGSEIAIESGVFGVEDHVLIMNAVYRLDVTRY